MSMMVIQVPMPASLVKAVTRSARERRSTRAALIREACQRFLEGLEEEELERKHLEGYRRVPESVAVGRRGEKMAKEVWSREDWHEAW